ncbi:MAG TPA: M14 family metallopeptidase [Chitinophagaceae bacterium]|nr:M14 family metallopeptidase [Chitinophagaceae bacterium]
MVLSRAFFLYMVCVLAIPTCGLNRNELPKPDYSEPVDTRSKTVVMQEKRHYRFDHKSITVDNLFDGARLNNARMAGNTLRVTISPENVPINGSSWYAFRITSQKKQQITLELNYSYKEHRYAPKWSTNGVDWNLVDARKIKINKTKNKVWFTLNLPAGPLWIAAQEIVSSRDVMTWCRQLSTNPMVRFSVIGRSALEKDIPCLDIYSGHEQPKQTIVILGRHHPPEVTGHFALEAFVESLLSHPQAATFFEKYRVVVLPLINPDGVDLGHWRHNAQGVDLNRDYAEYNQPEIKAVAGFLTGLAEDGKAEILMGLDFHSTYKDVYYTSRETEGVKLVPIQSRWLEAIERGLEEYDYDLREEKHSVNTNPSSQHWFYHQFRALGITYEIGDNTSRDFIRTKAKVSADALIKQLVNH